MATEQFDTDWRVVAVWNDDTLEASVAEVECFEFYGPALQHWRLLDEQHRARELVQWKLVDPNGLVLLMGSRYYNVDLHRSQLAGAEPGRYRWADDRLGYVVLP